MSETTNFCLSYADKCHDSKLCSSEDIFNSSDDGVKKKHTETLSYMVYVAHVLPLACDSKAVRKSIFIPRSSWNFHGKWPLNGWNDDIIQPARDAVLEYYKVCSIGTLLICTLLIQVKWNSILSAM